MIRNETFLQKFLSEHDYCNEITLDGTDLLFYFMPALASCSVLKLTDVKGACFPEGKYCYISDAVLHFNEETGRWTLSFTGHCEIEQDKTDLTTPDAEKEELKEYRISFSFAYLETLVFNACTEMYLWGNYPWMHLGMIAGGICDKSELSEDLLNEEEKELLPLLKELNILTGHTVSEGKKQSFPALSERLRQSDFEEMRSLISKLENEYDSSAGFQKKSNILLKKLTNAKYYPFWRKLFDDVSHSQKDYPSRAEFYVDKKDTMKVREIIETRLKKYGFSGAYPDFYRFGEKGTAVINCRETSNENGELTIQFSCGRDKTGSKQPDIYCCLFEKSGRDTIKTLTWERWDEADDSFQTLSKYMDIAMKISAREKLSKEEKQYVTGIPVVTVEAFFISSLILGIITTIVAVPIFMLFAALITLIIVGPSAVPDMFRALNWGGFTILTFFVGGFGGNILSVFFDKNKF